MPLNYNIWDRSLNLTLGSSYFKSLRSSLQSFLVGNPVLYNVHVVPARFMQVLEWWTPLHVYNLLFRKAERDVLCILDDMNLIEDENMFSGLSQKSLLSVLTNHGQDIQMMDHIRRLVRKNKDILKGIYKLFTNNNAQSFLMKSNTSLI